MDDQCQVHKTTKIMDIIIMDKDTPNQGWHSDAKQIISKLTDESRTYSN